MDAVLLDKWRSGGGQVVQGVLGLAIAVLLVRRLNSRLRLRAEPKFKLYTNPICPYANRVWLTLFELDLLSTCELTPIPMAAEVAHAERTGELPPWAESVGIVSPLALKQLKEWYTLNFGPAVPVLVENSDGLVIKESDVICEYLDVIAQGKLLVPRNRDVIRVRLAQSSFQPAVLYKLLSNLDRTQHPTLLADVVKMIVNFTSHMNSSQTGPYYLGNRFSLADIVAIPFVARFQITLKHYRASI
ncbi:hypothetical protein BASA82_000205 [Batrachochytrium salamandrivorans]|nr:hypothetical protein BASA81_001698 [Batrachochytrium salamandrivorans]KAH9262764.1 hypothetical protein BASA82_000205 [Batrachochytrium salamandrivorans]